MQKGLCHTNIESFYMNLTQAYDQHNYMLVQIWHYNESRTQVGQNGGRLVLVQINFRYVHSITLNEKEWLFVLYCISIAKKCVLNFYI
jgi:hypothetical protein